MTALLKHQKHDKSPPTIVCGELLPNTNEANTQECKENKRHFNTFNRPPVTLCVAIGCYANASRDSQFTLTIGSNRC